nr:MAG TPA: hypothetical protein [Bacteriophage sp.]
MFYGAWAHGETCNMQVSRQDEKMADGIGRMFSFWRGI